MFHEGALAFKGAGIKLKSHIQIAVRDPQACRLLILKGEMRNCCQQVQDSLSSGGGLWQGGWMKVERLKYVIWAVDMNRAVNFYAYVFGGTILKQNDIISEVSICDGIIGIHGGGEGGRTWTGLSFQVADVIEGAREIVAAGGQLTREPQPENGEPPHLAMCVDTEGNEIMLTRKRVH